MQVTLNALPASLAEFRNLSLNTPDEVVAGFLCALNLYVKNPNEGVEAMNILRGPRPMTPYFTDSDPQAKLTYADLKEHIGVDCSEYQYQEEYQRGVYTWYAAEDEACCLSLFFGDNGKLMAAGAYNLSL